MNRVLIYCRVSRVDQHPEAQQFELRRYAEARGWTIVRELVDHGVSGAKESRPAFNQMMADARHRRFDILLVHKIDRLGRSLRHLLFTIDQLVELKIQFVSMNEGIDTGSITGTFMLHILGALSQMERSKLSERTKLGLERARRQGVRLGRKRPNVSDEAIEALNSLSVRTAAKKLGISKSFVHKFRARRVKASEQSGTLTV